ncbi:hypothetical protein, partial [Silvimonas sp.]|uniref:hypothetical protein n=1 Tax=Silvimonas sp. TaxID=2650811 RepID=UPI00284A9AAD
RGRAFVPRIMADQHAKAVVAREQPRLHFIKPGFMMQRDTYNPRGIGDERHGLHKDNLRTITGVRTSAVPISAHAKTPTW